MIVGSTTFENFTSVGITVLIKSLKLPVIVSVDTVFVVREGAEEPEADEVCGGAVTVFVREAQLPSITFKTGLRYEAAQEVLVQDCE